jgi:hypothetical protein
MVLRELFEKDPGRRISPVVVVDRHDEEIAGVEVEEYVVTDPIRRAFDDILDRFVESRMGRVEGVCAWISGFFGSGKSHFLKMLGYILENRRIRLPNGQEIQVAEYFAEKHGLAAARVIAGELQTKALYVNMLVYDREKDKDLSRFVYKSLLRQLDLSDIFWVAEIELMLQKKGLWEKFQEFVAREEELTWAEARRVESRVRSLLVRGLVEADPKAFPDISLAEAAVRDAKEEFTTNPETLARRLVQEALALNKENGRIALLLDEVGLYVMGREADRLTELNALAERVEKLGGGRVWIFATAQEALEQVIKRTEARRAELEWIRDRFRMKVTLGPENIARVVNKRLLEKDRESSEYKTLLEAYGAIEGTLKLSVLLDKPARDPTGHLTNLSRDDVMATYPLMPYYVPVLVDVFAVLRSRGRASPELTGRERAVLGVARSALQNLLDAEVGRLLTFDLMYNAIDEELKAVRSEYQAIIQTEIESLGEREGMKVTSVATALFLLQQVGEWIPTTAHNLSAVLYPVLGADQQEHLQKVEACLGALVESKWITEEEGRFRFLSNVERTFEEDVGGQQIARRERSNLVHSVATEALKDLKKYTYKGHRVFNVHLSVDGKEVTAKGHLRLSLFTPLWARAQEDTASHLYNKSLAEPDAVFWLCKEDGGFLGKLDRVVGIRKTLDERERKSPSPDELRELDRYRKEKEQIQDDELPKLLRTLAAGGTLFFQGKQASLEGKERMTKVFNEWMQALADELFTEFDDGDARIRREEDIGAIIHWTGGTLPAAYAELGLVKDGVIRTNVPVADKVLREAKRRIGKGEECTGSSLAAHFEAPPFGWDSRVLRLALATLFKNGNLQVESEGRQLTSTDAPGAANTFVRIRAFNRASFNLGATVTPEQRKEAASLISEVFGVQGGLTNEEIAEALGSSANEALEALRELLATEGYHAFPFGDRLATLREALDRVSGEPSYPLRILAFLDEGTLEPIREFVPLLTEASEFVQSGRAKIFLEMRRFVEEPLRALVDTDMEKEEGAEKLRQLLEDADLLSRWKEAYDRYQGLLRRYEELYRESHVDRERQLKSTIKSLTSWAENHGLGEQEIEGPLTRLVELRCPAGPKPTSTRFSCGDCMDGLRAIRGHLEVIPARGEAARAAMARALGKSKEAPPMEGSYRFEGNVSSGQEFEEGVRAAFDIVRYWTARGKDVSVRLEVTADTEQGEEE